MVVIVGFFSCVGFIILDKRAEKFKKVLEEEYEDMNETEDLMWRKGSVPENVALIVNERSYPRDEKSDDSESITCSQFFKEVWASLKHIKVRKQDFLISNLKFFHFEIGF